MANDPMPTEAMPTGPTGPTVPWGERLSAIPKPVLYLILILVTAVPQFFTLGFPNVPDRSSVDLYRALVALTPQDRVLVASDWTNSTRGESRAEFIALVKILMEKDVKFAFYSTADPQAPQAALDAIAVVNDQRMLKNKRAYRRGADYTNLGFFANSEATNNGLANDLPSTFSPKKDLGVPALTTPPLAGVRRVGDFKLLVVVTASKTSNITVERVSGKVPLAFMVTGVMGPETSVFYQSGQILGLLNGLKGAFDLEGLIANGSKDDNLPPTIPGDEPGQGTKFYPTLHFAMALLIIMIVIGNVATLSMRRRTRGLESAGGAR